MSRCGVVRAVKDQPLLEWPWWANWALIGVIVTAIVTVAATINDIW
ncbi:MAG TPA: hypothetical protein VNR86_11695 [Sphingomicrobium sp.]|nr:hypothetical protein [Sphingomicrobium sp.]